MIVHALVHSTGDGCTYSTDDVIHAFTDKDSADYVVDSLNASSKDEDYSSFRVDRIDIDPSTSMRKLDRVIRSIKNKLGL